MRSSKIETEWARGRRNKIELKEKKCERNWESDDRLCWMFGQSMKAVTSASVVWWYKSDRGPGWRFQAALSETFSKKLCLDFLCCLSFLPVTTISSQKKRNRQQIQSKRQRGRKREGQWETEASHFWYSGLIMSRQDMSYKSAKGKKKKDKWGSSI